METQNQTMPIAARSWDRSRRPRRSRTSSRRSRRSARRPSKGRRTKRSHRSKSTVHHIVHRPSVVERVVEVPRVMHPVMHSVVYQPYVRDRASSRDVPMGTPVEHVPMGTPVDCPAGQQMVGDMCLDNQEVAAAREVQRQYDRRNSA